MKKQIAFIINPISGTMNKNHLPQLVEKYLDKSQFEPHIVFTQQAGDGTRLAMEYAQKQFYAVVAVGGDGSVNEIGQSLVNTNTAMGIIPTGSGNGLARHLRIPLNIEKAIQLINHSEIIKADYGLVNDKPFFCTCGTGFDASVSMEFAKAEKRGLITYVEKMIETYRNYKPQRYMVEGKGVMFDDRAFLITFANASQWGNNAYIAPQASIQDGMLDISVIGKFPSIVAPAVLLQLFTKRIAKDLFVNTFRASSIRLIREEAGAFHRDGEPCEEGKELNISVVENGLNVLVAKRF